MNSFVSRDAAMLVSLPLSMQREGRRAENWGKLGKKNSLFPLVAVHLAAILHPKMISECCCCWGMSYALRMNLISLWIEIHKHGAKYRIVQLFLSVLQDRHLCDSVPVITLWLSEFLLNALLIKGSLFIFNYCRWITEPKLTNMWWAAQPDIFNLSLFFASDLCRSVTCLRKSWLTA